MVFSLHYRTSSDTDHKSTTDERKLLIACVDTSGTTRIIRYTENTVLLGCCEYMILLPRRRERFFFCLLTCHVAALRSRLFLPTQLTLDSSNSTEEAAPAQGHHDLPTCQEGGNVCGSRSFQSGASTAFNALERPLGGAPRDSHFGCMSGLRSCLAVLGAPRSICRVNSYDSVR